MIKSTPEDTARIDGITPIAFPAAEKQEMRGQPFLHFYSTHGILSSVRVAAFKRRPLDRLQARDGRAQDLFFRVGMAIH